MDWFSYGTFPLYPSTQSALYNQGHSAIYTSTYFLYDRASCLAFTHIHTLIDATWGHYPAQGYLAY